MFEKIGEIVKLLAFEPRAVASVLTSARAGVLSRKYVVRIFHMLKLYQMILIILLCLDIHMC